MKLLALFSVILTLVLIQSVVSQMFGLGSCPHVKAFGNFVEGDFYGKWFEISKYAQIFPSGKCVAMDVSQAGEGNVMLESTDVFGRNEKIRKHSHIATPGKPGTFNFKYDLFISKFSPLFFIKF